MLDTVAKGSEDDLVSARVLGELHDQDADVVDDRCRDAGDNEKDGRGEEQERRGDVTDALGLHPCWETSSICESDAWKR